jgi:hypothetical protein
MNATRIFFGVAALLATAVHGQPNDAAWLQGCWQLDETVTTRLSGETFSHKPQEQCRDWIGAGMITSACRDRLGLVRGDSRSSYEISDPGTMVLRSHLTLSPEKKEMMPPSSEGVGFEQGRLRRSKIYSWVKSTDKNPNPAVRYDSYYKRVSADENHCIPRTEQVEARDARTLWRGRELAHSFRLSMHELALTMSFKEAGIAEMMKAEMPQEERVRVIRELRKIFDHATTLGMTNWADQAASLEKAWTDKNVCGNQKETLFLISPAVRQWADDTVRETIALQRLIPRFTAAMFLYPDEAKKLLGDSSMESRMDEKRFAVGAILKDGPFGLFALPRIAVARLADNPHIAKMIDPETDFKVLRDLGRRNIEFFEKNALTYTSILDCPRQLAASFPQADEATLQASERAFKEGLKTLRARVEAAAYLRNGPPARICESVENAINMESLRASQGNVGRILDSKGQPIIDKGALIFTAMRAYTHGCGVPRNIALSRQILDQGSVAMGSNKLKGKLEHLAWCQLAGWYRYGIGGPIILKEAEAWEKRVKDEVTPTGCPSVKLIDPSDPWRVIE